MNKDDAGQRAPHGDPWGQDEYDDDGECEQCGGEGYVMLSDAGPSEWGEDTFCEIDREIVCPTCKGLP